MRFQVLKFGALSALALAAGAASAAVEVRFIEPDNYVDVRSNSRDREQVLGALDAHLRQLGDKQLPGKDLLIEVTDIDLAGEVEPRGRLMQEVRVLRNITRPAMSLRYVVSEGGRELRRGEARLSDLGYLDRANRYFESDSIRYEKRMLDDWFKVEFAAARP